MPSPTKAELLAAVAEGESSLEDLFSSNGRKGRRGGGAAGAGGAGQTQQRRYGGAGAPLNPDPAQLSERVAQLHAQLKQVQEDLR